MPKEIPSPPAHLVQGSGAGPRVPPKPKLPQHRAITRPTGLLRPHTHPFAKDEVAVILRSGRLQQTMRQISGAADIVRTMQLLSKEAYKMEHLGESPMSYWLNNVKAELVSRGLNPPSGSEAMMRIWLQAFKSSRAVFTGLIRDDPEPNVIVCPVEYHLYDAERKQQQDATAKAQKEIDAWETEHGEAMRAHKERCDEWRDYARVKACAVAYHDMATKEQNLAAPQTYVFEEVSKSMKNDKDQPDFSFFFRDPDAVGKDKLKRMKSKSASVAGELERYRTEHADVPHFKAQLLLRNAWSASDAYAARLRKEIANAKELETSSHTWLKSYAHKRARVVLELGTFKAQQREVEATGKRVYKETLDAAYAHGYTRGDREVWHWNGWMKPFIGTMNECAGTAGELGWRQGRLVIIAANYGKLASTLGDMLEAHEREFAKLPRPEPEINSDDEEDDVLLVDLVTREERDARGWQEAEVLD